MNSHDGPRDFLIDHSPPPTDSPAPAGWSVLLSGTNAIRSLTLAGGVALHAINVYIATTILPSVVRNIGGLDLYAWNTTIFVVASILGSALSAKLLQRAGPRGAYAIAGTIFAPGALLCATAASMPILLIGRLVQGLGGGFLFALAYAMIRVVFDVALWPRAMALVSGMWGVATLVGPAIGGVFAELGIWRAAFWSLAPISLLFVILALVVLPKHKPQGDKQAAAPLAQLGLLMAAVLVISAGSTSPNVAWNSVGIIAAIILSGLLVLTEGRARWKLLPSDAFRPTSPIAALYLSMCLLAVTITSGEIFVPLFLQILHHQSPLVAGYLAALMAAGWTIGSILGSGAGERVTGRLIMSGPVLQLIGVIALLVLMPIGGAGTWTELAPICVALIAIGLGVGLCWPHLLTRVLRVAPPAEQELAGASITTVQLFATTIGAALAGMVANAGGLVDPGGAQGTADAARWLFGAFFMGPLLCLVSARRVAVLT